MLESALESKAFRKLFRILFQGVGSIFYSIYSTGAVGLSTATGALLGCLVLARMFLGLERSFLVTELVAALRLFLREDLAGLMRGS